MSGLDDCEGDIHHTCPFKSDSRDKTDEIEEIPPNEGWDARIEWMCR